MDPFTTRQARLPDELQLIHAIRHRVFVGEQRIPAQLEWDGQDATARHVLAFAPSGEAVGTGRLLPGGRIGRMAVDPAWRNCGIGRAILAALLAMARAGGRPRVHLHAQAAVTGFYRKAGFRPTGRPFTEAGISHVRMEKTLPLANNGREPPPRGTP